MSFVNWSWGVDAACRGLGLDFFFPDSNVFDAALTVCDECPVREPCLDYALDNPELFGVWGGTTPYERFKIRHTGL